MLRKSRGMCYRRKEELRPQDSTHLLSSAEGAPKKPGPSRGPVRCTHLRVVDPNQRLTQIGSSFSPPFGISRIAKKPTSMSGRSLIGGRSSCATPEAFATALPME